MSADLTLPGTIPGLLRRGSPVRRVGDGASMVVVLTCEEGPWCATMGPDWSGDGESAWGVDATWDDVALDLTDATGRAHAAWWTEERTGAGSDWCAYFDRAGRRSRGEFWEEGLRGLAEQVSAHSLFALLSGHLPEDAPRTLPDGSRWVDAEALRRVVLHIAGVSP